MDLALFRFFNSFVGHGFDGVIVALASYLQYALIALFIGASLWPTRKYALLISGLGAAFIARFGVKTLIITFVERARPYAALPDAHAVISQDAGEQLQSLPSGHAIFFFALAMVAYRSDVRLGRWLFAGATIMGIARVVGAAHWPFDILVGAFLGILVGYIATIISAKLAPSSG